MKILHDILSLFFTLILSDNQYTYSVTEITGIKNKTYEFHKRFIRES